MGHQFQVNEIVVDNARKHSLSVAKSASSIDGILSLMTCRRTLRSPRSRRAACQSNNNNWNKRSVSFPLPPIKEQIEQFQISRLQTMEMKGISAPNKVSTMSKTTTTLHVDRVPRKPKRSTTELSEVLDAVLAINVLDMETSSC